MMRLYCFIIVLQMLDFTGLAQSQALKKIQERLTDMRGNVNKNYPANTVNSTVQSSQSCSAMQALKGLDKLKHLPVVNVPAAKPSGTSFLQLHDTIVVGYTPNDTLKITGYWTHSGPIIILNDGVVYIKNATVIDSGDVYVLNHGKFVAEASSLTFPQQYFYQRSLLATHQGEVHITNCSFDYSGLSHNLIAAGSSTVSMNHIHQRDWTTCGMYDQATLTINHCNLAGEYVITDSTKLDFKNTDTVLLWHKVPNLASLTFDFPNGDTVYNYHFHNGISGINNIKYNVSADSCHNAMWALMPVNGSSVTVSNSKLRAIGLWFQRGDNASVNGLFDNSQYTAFTAPLSDRVLQLNNCDLQTWNLYTFDSSHVDITNSQVGEIGSMNRSSVQATQPITVDGSGGYFWATDTTGVLSFGASVYSFVRSERNGLFILAYGYVPFTAPQAIGKSIMVTVQSNTLYDPVAYDEATAWQTKIETPDTSYTQTTIPVIGSTWVDWGPQGNGWMNFSKYSLYVQQQGASGWTGLVKDSALEIRHNSLGNWNTSTLQPGNYMLRLVSYNNYNDSIEALKPIVLKNQLATGITPGQASHQYYVFPNPAKNEVFIGGLTEPENVIVELYNVLGEKVKTIQVITPEVKCNVAGFSEGLYTVVIKNHNAAVFTTKLIIH